jgi:hemoglobin/transferrin/lactoferrin receptor protein
VLAAGQVAAVAQTVPDPAAETSAATALPPVTIQGRRASTTPPTETSTVIDSQTIERKQSSTIFDLVKDAPGVSVDGGPRATGMKFNIRGFRDNDDVLFKIDGAVKGFEKYRFGSGVFIEPELIKSITIERGPSVLTGAGAIGGAVIATTKSAADLLLPGQRVGGLAKAGYDDNNRERLGMLAVYGRPTDNSDLLVTWMRRDSDDFKLANGSRLPATGNHIEGSLIKLTLFPIDDLNVELSRTAYTSGPTYTPFDTNSSNAYVGGYVHQSIDDETYNLRFHYEPALAWLKLRGTLAHETTDLSNLMLTGPGESSFTVPCTTDPCRWSPYGGATGNMTDRWKYDIWTAEVFNESRYALGPVRGVLTLGMQGLRNKRDLRRLTENPLMNGPDGKYPGGYDEQQPPGSKSSAGAIVQNAFVWGDFTFTPGLRRDRYELEADGQSATDRSAVGEPTRYDFSRTTRSAALTWRPGQGPWWFTYRWSEGFKPPLLTDYFGMQAASPCAGFRTAGGQPIAPYGCGDRLTSTTSINREWTLGWTPLRWPWGGLTQARATYYDIATKHLVGASYLAVENDTIVQPYDERRHGVEVELSHEERRWYLTINAGRISAERGDTRLGDWSRFTGGIPGPTASLSAGYRLFDERLELGYRLRQIWDQMVLPNATALTETTQYCGKVVAGGVVHAANTQQDVFAVWRPERMLSVYVGINNFFNKHWCNNGDELGNVIGLQGPGRSVRANVTLQY